MTYKISQMAYTMNKYKIKAETSKSSNLIA